MADPVTTPDASESPPHLTPVEVTPQRKRTRGERMIAFIETYCKVPEGNLVGKPLVLMPFQRKFILDVYDNPFRTSRAYLSIGRKNGKTALIAALVLGHLVGPEAVLNSQIISGARSRKQAALVFKLASKMIRLSPELSKITRVIPSEKTIWGLRMNVEYQAISAEAGTAHGLSPIVAILDEVGQVKGPQDDFVEAIETSQGAYEDQALLFAISTQAATDADLFSTWIDDAEMSQDPHIVSHIYSAPEDCELDDRKAWAMANPAMGAFRSLKELVEFAERAQRMPAAENSFRWLYLNQRVNSFAPFISKSLWKSCDAEPAPFDKDTEVYIALDLSAVKDLTCAVAIGKRPQDKVWSCVPSFWMPQVGIVERSKQDRVPYDIWADKGFLEATPGKAVDYAFAAKWLFDMCQDFNVKKIGYDRWGFKHFRPYLIEAGFSEEQCDETLFIEFGQGFQSMAPALNALEGDILNGLLAHGGHPVLTMCASNAVEVKDPAGNRKLAKNKSTGRIDGMVALAMARGIVPLEVKEAKPEPKYQLVILG